MGLENNPTRVYFLMIVILTKKTHVSLISALKDGVFARTEIDKWIKIEGDHVYQVKKQMRFLKYWGLDIDYVNTKLEDYVLEKV